MNHVDEERSQEGAVYQRVGSAAEVVVNQAALVSTA